MTSSTKPEVRASNVLPPRRKVAMHGKF